MRRNRPGKLRPGERVSPRPPARTRPVTQSAAGWGREKRAAPAWLGGSSPGAPPESGRGPPGEPRVRAPACGPLTWRGRSEGGAGGAAAPLSAEHKAQPPPREGRREVGRGRRGRGRGDGGTRPALGPRAGGLDAARGAGALCLGASGARSPPPGRPPAPPLSRAQGPAGGWGCICGPRRPPWASGVPPPVTRRGGEGLSPWVSPSPAPLHASPWRETWARNRRETKKPGGGSPSPPTCPRRPVRVRPPSQAPRRRTALTVNF